MPLSRAPRAPDLERVVQVLGGGHSGEGERPRGLGGWVPARPETGRGLEVGQGADDVDDVDGSDDADDLAALEAELRRARRPGLLTVPEGIRSGRIAVSSTAIVAVLALVIALGCAFVVRVLWAERTESAAPARVASGAPGVSGVSTPQVDSRTGPGAPTPKVGVTPTPQALLVVHVVGQVRSPGLVRLSPGSRVADAITAAGGPTRSADTTALNLARLVVDGEQIHVPKPGEVVPAPAGGEGAGGGASGAAGGTAAGSSGGGLVNLNTADAGALDTLPGVGPVLAQRILDWRTEHGRFSSVDELGEVSGIGDKLMSQLRSKVSV